MKYNITVFGTKNTTAEIVKYICAHISKVDLIVTVDNTVHAKSQISGFSGMDQAAEEYNIELFKACSYGLADERSLQFFKNNDFDIGISMGWQRLIPEEVLKRFKFGVFGFHGSCAYLPYGRGRSPLNWSIINGDRRYIFNLFQYDTGIDSPNVFSREMFEINMHDTIQTLQYKTMISSQRQIALLLKAYEQKNIQISTDSNDIDTIYKKRTQEDGRIFFSGKTRDIYNLIRGVTRPFPGAFCFLNETRVTVWDAKPFDDRMDFSMYCPGEVIRVFDNCPIIRTVDGSIIVYEYEAAAVIHERDILN